MKTFIKILLILALALIGLVLSSELSAAVPTYTLSYELERDGGYYKAEITIVEESGWFIRVDRCFGDLYGSIDELTDTEELIYTNWIKCFSGTDPNTVILNLILKLSKKED